MLLLHGPGGSVWMWPSLHSEDGQGGSHQLVSSTAKSILWLWPWQPEKPQQAPATHIQLFCSWESQKHRRVCMGRELKDHLVPTLLSWTGHLSLDQVAPSSTQSRFPVERKSLSNPSDQRCQAQWKTQETKSPFISLISDWSWNILIWSPNYCQEFPLALQVLWVLPHQVLRKQSQHGDGTPGCKVAEQQEGHTCHCHKHKSQKSTTRAQIHPASFPARTPI